MCSEYLHNQCPKLNSETIIKLLDQNKNSILYLIKDSRNQFRYRETLGG